MDMTSFNMRVVQTNPSNRTIIDWNCSRCSITGKRTYKNHKKSCLSQSRFVREHLCPACFRNLPEYKQAADRSYFKSDEFKQINSSNSKRRWNDPEKRRQLEGGLAKSRTDEWRGKLSDALTAKFRDDRDYCNKIRVARGRYKRLESRLTVAEFINKSRVIHGNQYDYSLVSFEKARDTKVDIICPIHGIFQQRVIWHYFYGNGCPSCAAVPRITKPHQYLIDLIDGWGINQVANDRQEIKPLELDIYIPQYKLAIEFNGDYHHSIVDLSKRYKHQHKIDLCSESGIMLLQIQEYLWKGRSAIYESMIAHKLGRSERIGARQCVIVKNNLSKFIGANHLRGNKTADHYYGLAYRGSIMSAISITDHNHGILEIARFTNLLNHTVVGGLSRLLKAVIDDLRPMEIFTYADRMHGEGNGYLTAGFATDGRTKPGYRYYKNGIIYPRQKYQKHKLHALLPNFDACLTEQENMINSGYRLLYDAGHNRYRMRVR